MTHLPFSLFKRRHLFLYLSLVQIGCSSQPQRAVSSPEERLVFGRGGGISGEVRSYILLGNGQLHETSSLFADTTYLRSLESDATQRLFDQADSLLQADSGFQHPGNRYYFIQHQRREVTWGDPAISPPSAIQRLYDSLQRTISKQK